jgi:hypothetical protein
MSAHSHTDQPAPAPAPASRGKVAKALAVVAAVAALAFGANAITNHSASTGAGTQAAARTGPGGGAPPQGMGTQVSGATLTKLAAAATAKYPGKVEHAMQLPDGSYVVHVIRSGNQGEVHVLVSKAFKVTGVQQGGPPGGAQS